MPEEQQQEELERRPATTPEDSMKDDQGDDVKTFDAPEEEEEAEEQRNSEKIGPNESEPAKDDQPGHDEDAADAMTDHDTGEKDDEEQVPVDASHIADGREQVKEGKETVTPQAMTHDSKGSDDAPGTSGERGTTPKSEETGRTSEGDSPDGKPHQHDHHHQQYPPYPTSPMMHHPYYGGYMYPPMYSYGGYPPPYSHHPPPIGPSGQPYYPPYNMPPTSGSHHHAPPEAGSPTHLPNAFLPPPFHAYPPASPVVSPRNGGVTAGPENQFFPYHHPNYGYPPYPVGGDDAFAPKSQERNPAMQDSDDDEEEEGSRRTSKENTAADSADNNEDIDGESPRSNNPRLQVYIKSKQRVPRDILDRRNHKNAASRARSAGYRTRVAQIELKPLSERTESENDLVRLYNKRRHMKNERSRVRSVERKETIDRILSLPENKRTKLEKQFLEAALGAKERKNQGDRLRRQRMKELGDNAKKMQMRVAAAAAGAGGHQGQILPPHAYQYPYNGYSPHHPYGMVPPGYHPSMGHPQPHSGPPPYFASGDHRNAVPSNGDPMVSEGPAAAAPPASPDGAEAYPL